MTTAEVVGIMRFLIAALNSLSTAALAAMKGEEAGLKSACESALRWVKAADRALTRRIGDSKDGGTKVKGSNA